MALRESRTLEALEATSRGRASPVMTRNRSESLGVTRYNRKIRYYRNQASARGSISAAKRAGVRPVAKASQKPPTIEKIVHSEKKVKVSMVEGFKFEEDDGDVEMELWPGINEAAAGLSNDLMYPGS